MNTLNSWRVFTLCIMGILLMAPHAWAQSDNGRGRHKQLYAVPAPAKVVIDGKLDEWDLSAQIEMFVIEATRATQAAKFAVMYDNDAIYLSGDVNDPSPMMNRHDPLTNANVAWNADSCQFRLTIDPAAGYPISETTFKYKGDKAPPDTRTDIMHLLMWNYTDQEQANLQMHTGMTYRSPRSEWEPFGLVPQDKFEGKYLRRADGTGYSFEYRIPWSTLGAKKPLNAGDVVASTVQFSWSRPDGLATAGSSAWAYDVLRTPGFAFQNTECWGQMIFSEKGNVPRELVSQGVPPERSLPLEFSYDLPRDSEATIQLFNEQGDNVRILVPQQQRLGGKNIERWDGLDDQGNPLPAGTYQWKGIYHDPIEAKFRFSAHNSGNPPYPTDNNKGGWGGDHGTPQAAVALKDGMILSWNGSEYGWGIIRTDLNGKKQWGSNQNATYMASDEKLIYYTDDHLFPSRVKMIATKDARPARIADDINEITPPFENDETKSNVSGLSYHDQKLYVSFADKNVIGVYSTTQGKWLATWNLPTPGRSAVHPDGSLAVISDGKIVNIADGKVSPWISEHLDQPAGIVIDGDGNAYVTNRGSMQNVSVFNADGSYLRSIGKRGGRPAKGAYDPAGMYEAGGLSLDSKGQLWIAETTDGPKRISVWNAQNGGLIAEYFGGSEYFGYGHIDPKKPNEIYAHHVMWDIDWAKYTVTLTTTIWRQTSPNMMPPPGPAAYQNHPRIVTANDGRQYMWGTARKTLSILLQRDGDLFKPFAAILRVPNRDSRYYLPTGINVIDEDSESFPEGYYFWQDTNADQTVQPDEVKRVAKMFDNTQFAWLDADLSIRLRTGHMLRPISLQSNGLPTYDLDKADPTPLADAPLCRGSRYITHGPEGEVYTLGNERLIAWSADGHKRWSYTGITSWHKSLNLPIVKAGRLHGMTGAMGIAGDYLAHQTYFGPNHLFRRDGVYVGAILKDSRIGGLGANEGQPEGQNGSFVKLNLQDKDRYFAIGGGQDVRVWEVLGLDTVQDLTGGVYHHTPQMVAQAEAAQEAYRQALDGVKQLIITKGRKAMEASPAVKRMLEGERGFEARVAYDADHLYVQFDVTSPHGLINNAADPHTIFRGGNLLDIQLATAPSADVGRELPAAGDVRLLITRQEGKPFAVLFRPKVKNFAGEPIVLKSPTGQESFDVIEVLDSVALEYNKTSAGFTAIVAIPLQKLGLNLKSGQKLLMDLGYIFGNKQGTRTAIRAYLNNNSFTANVVDDIPHESRLEPAQWGSAIVE